MMRLHDDKAVFRPEGLTTRPHTDLYLSGDFILMCLGSTVKTKGNQFCRFPGKSDLVKVCTISFERPEGSP